MDFRSKNNYFNKINVCKKFHIITYNVISFNINN